jgi:F-type H+-transporting ATPase subunit b
MNTLLFFNNSFQNSFEINHDLFDTNIINLSIVLIIVIRFLGAAIINILDQRKQNIIINLQNSNKKVIVVKDKLNEVKIKLRLTRLDMKDVYTSRFSMFINRKRIYLNKVDSYLNQLGSLRSDVIDCQTKKVLSDVYNETISITFDKLYKNLRYTFNKSSIDFTNKSKMTTYNYLKRIN